MGRVQFGTRGGYVRVDEPISYDEILLQAQGWVSQNFDRALATQNPILIDGTIYFQLVPLRAGDIVSTISIIVQTAATTMSIGKVGLYDTSGNLLASSASQTTAWESQGRKDVALTAAYTVPTTGGYYAAVFAKASTLPHLAGGSNQSFAGTPLGSNPRTMASQASQTDLTNPATFANSAIANWVGLS